MDAPEFILVMASIIIPALLLSFVLRRWFDLKARKLEIEAAGVAERAARYATDNAKLEQRVRVLEQIVTDGGAQTAAQIEALRTAPSLEKIHDDSNIQ